MSDGIRRHAVIDETGTYRYRLTREWGPLGEGCKRICWIMLNPSTADGLTDDPTIRKCIGFTQRLGFNAFEVVNLYAFRATDPKDLTRAFKLGRDVVGPLNHEFTREAIDRSSLVICAWGAGVRSVDLEFLAEDVVTAATAHHAQVRCLGRAKQSEPRHPLMLPYSAQLEAWP